VKLSSILSRDEWNYIVERCVPAKIKPELIVAIGWHETHWGRLGMGRYGYHLGISCWTRNDTQFEYDKSHGLVDWESYSKTKYGHLYGSITLKGYQKQVDWAVNHFKGKIPLDIQYKDVEYIAKNIWKPANPYNWARSVWSIYTSLEDDLSPRNHEASVDDIPTAEGDLPSSAGILQKIAYYLEEIAKLLREWRV